MTATTLAGSEIVWFNVDDKLHAHRKARRAGLEAMGLWVLAGSWVSDNGAHGFVPRQQLHAWGDNVDALAARLVDAGFWVEAIVEGETGYVFHDYAEWNSWAIEVAQQRRASADRQRRYRVNKKRREQQASGQSALFEDDEHTETSRNALRDGHGNPLDTTTNTKSGTGSYTGGSPSVVTLASRDDLVQSTFDEFWNTYPRRAGKGRARQAYAKAIERASIADVLAGAKRYRDDPNRVDAFTAHPATWLNQDRWDDDPLPPRPAREQGLDRRVADYLEGDDHGPGAGAPGARQVRGVRQPRPVERGDAGLG